MDNPSAFGAAYSDWKIIRTRGVIQIVFEVPIEAEGAAYAALGGMPKQDRSDWFAIARMKKPNALAAD